MRSSDHGRPAILITAELNSLPSHTSLFQNLCLFCRFLARAVLRVSVSSVLIAKERS